MREPSVGSAGDDGEGQMAFGSQEGSEKSGMMQMADDQSEVSGMMQMVGDDESDANAAMDLGTATRAPVIAERAHDDSA